MSVYRFGEFTFDTASLRLAARGEARPLEPKSFRLLQFLIENRERVAGKTEILRVVWEDMAVTDNALTRAVAQIRKALDDDPKQPCYIETVPTVGYRFIAELHHEEIGNGGESQSSAVGAAVPKRTLVKARWLAAALTAGIAAAGYFLWVTPAPSAGAAWTQLTSFDSATSPALSSDGRLLTFIRGENPFVGPGDVYLKLLPDGDPVRLTRDGTKKLSPVVAPDGSRIAYTVVDGNFRWDTFMVTVLGGEPQRWLPNAAALTWTGRNTVLFSEIKSGAHMGIVTAGEDRANERDVYLPAHERAMAHRSYRSPDGRNVLVAEMGANGSFVPCRLVPFDGSSPGMQVGPANAGCTNAAWSPDGQWMYLNSSAGGAGYHIWRQRPGGGAPVQITFGPTEQEGIAVAPDGRSLISSVGQVQNSIWLVGPEGERQVTSEEDARFPTFSGDRSVLYYQSRTSDRPTAWELWRMDLSSGHRDRILTASNLTGLGVSPDDQQIVYTARDSDGHSRLWIAPRDHRTAPRQLPGTDITRPRFLPGGDLACLAQEGRQNFVFKSRPDGSSRQKLIPVPALDIYGFSPDGLWAVVWANAPGEGADKTVRGLVWPLAGGTPLQFCADCYMSWPPDGKSIFIEAADSVYQVPLPPGKMFPATPPGGIQGEPDVSAIPGARLISRKNAKGDCFCQMTARDSSSFVMVRSAVHRNLYRIPLH